MSKTVHFTLDDSTGILIMNIAQEHLLYGYNPVKALESIKKILMGCSDELALSILNGDKVIYVETDESTGEQNLMVTERTPENTSIFPKLAIDFFANHNIKEIITDSQRLVHAVKEKMNQMKYRNGLYITHSWNAVMNMTQGIDEDVLEEIRDTDEYQDLLLLAQVLRDFITRNVKKLSVIDFCNNAWGYTYNTKEATRCVADVADQFSKLLRQDYIKLVAFGEKSDSLPDIENVDLDAYISASTEINKTLETGIVPVDIMDNYSAGWLSPEGLFYGLNGHIANMLHNQIADALQEVGIVPNNDDNDNPDSWLEQKGWCKIHGNNVQFAGCLNNVVDKKKKNVNLTDEQIRIITHYIKVLHGGIISVGWKRERISAARFEMMATNNPTGLNKEYFQY